MSVKTTLILADDVAQKLAAELRGHGGPLEDLVNDLLRLGLNTRHELAAAEPFVVRARSLGTQPGVSFDKIGELS